MMEWMFFIRSLSPSLILFPGFSPVLLASKLFFFSFESEKTLLVLSDIMDLLLEPHEGSVSLILFLNLPSFHEKSRTVERRHPLSLSLSLSQKVALFTDVIQE
jgi:hypothetical protein